MRKHAFEVWASFIRQDLMRQRWNSTARRALRAWQWHVTLRWEVHAASTELQRRMNRWSVFQAWCTWLRMHDNKCAIQWMLHRSLSGAASEWLLATLASGSNCTGENSFGRQNDPGATCVSLFLSCCIKLVTLSTCRSFLT